MRATGEGKRQGPAGMDLQEKRLLAKPEKQHVKSRESPHPPAHPTPKVTPPCWRERVCGEEFIYKSFQKRGGIRFVGKSVHGQSGPWGPAECSSGQGRNYKKTNYSAAVKRMGDVPGNAWVPQDHFFGPLLARLIRYLRQADLGRKRIRRANCSIGGLVGNFHSQ